MKQGAGSRARGTVRGRRPGEVAWLKVGPDPALATCERCGGTEPAPPLPCPRDYAIAWMKVSIRRHRECEAWSVPADGAAGNGDQ